MTSLFTGQKFNDLLPIRVFSIMQYFRATGKRNALKEPRQNLHLVNYLQLLIKTAVQEDYA